MAPVRLAVLASGAGTTLQAVIDATGNPGFGAEVVSVGLDRDGSGAELRARSAGIPTWIERVTDYPERADFDAAVARRLSGVSPELVVLAGYMKILGPAVVDVYRCLNTHPALLPRHAGAHAVEDALQAGDAESGATVHWVDRGVDTGPVVAQVRVPVHPGDDVASLRARIQAAERPLFVATIGQLARQLQEARL